MDFNLNDSLNKYTLITHKHTDEYGNVICEQIDNELKQVVDREILLEQVPHPHMGLNIVYPEVNIIDGTTTNILLKEVNMSEQISSKNEMKVDYNTGKITVHYSLEGKYLICGYWGVGHSLIHSSRVYTKMNEYGNISQTLEDMIRIIQSMGNTDYIVDILKDIEDAKSSLVDSTNYENVTSRLESIEQRLRTQLTLIMSVNDKVLDMESSVSGVSDLVNEIDSRMIILENNFLSPSKVNNGDIDVILGGLV